MGPVFCFVGALALFVNCFSVGVECVVTITTPLNGDGNAAAKTIIPEDATSGEVITVVAISEPEGAPPVNAFAVVSPSDKFEFANTASGKLTVKSTASLDYEKKVKQIIIFTASDGTLTATGTVTVSIGDINDNTPVFKPASYSAIVPDNAAAGTTVATVTATDADGTEANNVITYSIETHSSFSMTDRVITVATGTTLSRATTPSYSLKVYATDSGTPARTAMTTVEVCVGSAEQCPRTATTTVKACVGSAEQCSRTETTTVKACVGSAEQCSTAVAITATLTTILAMLIMTLK